MAEHEGASGWTELERDCEPGDYPKSFSVRSTAEQTSGILEQCVFHESDSHAFQVAIKKIHCF